MGYGSKALEILSKFFQGNLINLDEGKNVIDLLRTSGFKENNDNSENLTEENLKPRKKLQPILKKLTELRPPLLHYLGVSYGLTKELFNFWRKNEFYPVYLRQSKNDLTAEHSCIMLKKLLDEPIEQEDSLNNEWLKGYYEDFKRRFLSLLAYEFKEIDIKLSLGVLEPNLTQNANEENDLAEEKDSIKKEELNFWLNLYDLKRLEAYSKNMVDFHLIIDLLPSLARLFFSKKFTKSLKFSYSQAAILMGMGLQHKSVEQIAAEINLPVAQVLALFNKAIRKITNHIKGIYEKEIEKNMNQKKDIDVRKKSIF
jgi:N-acetyltransferase 10